MANQIFDRARIAELGKTFDLPGLGSVNAFSDPRILQDVFEEVFGLHPPEDLIKTPPEGLETILHEIAVMDSVRGFQQALSQDISNLGEKNLNWVARILEIHVPGAYKKSDRVGPYRKQYGEWVATCHECNVDIAVARIKEGESLTFNPERTLYHDNLNSVYPNGKLQCNICEGEDFRLRQEANVVVIRDRADKSVLSERVKDMFEVVAQKIGKGTKEQLIFEYANAFKRLFPSVMTGTEINFDKFYKLMEWIKRQNLDIDQLDWIGEQKRNALKGAIFDSSYIPLPIAVIRTRTKALNRFYERVMFTLYGFIYKSDKAKDIDDIYGVRVVLASMRQAKKMRDIIKKGGLGLQIIQSTEKDNLENSRDYGYRGYHVKVRAGIYVVELQVKDHREDRRVETDPVLKHDEHVKGQRVLLEQIPPQIRAVGATILGVDPYYPRPLFTYSLK